MKSQSSKRSDRQKRKRKKNPHPFLPRSQRDPELVEINMIRLYLQKEMPKLADRISLWRRLYSNLKAMIDAEKDTSEIVKPESEIIIP